MKEEVWIGLINVVPQPNNDLLGTAKGAYVTALCYVDNNLSYKTRINEAAEELKFTVKEVEEIEKLSIRRKNFKVDEAILKLAKEVEETKQVRFSDFHAYE